MAAYAALVSLAGLINRTLPQDQDYAFLCDKEQMKSVHEKIILLQEFLESNSTKYVSSMVDVLESRIRDAAYKLEHVIESIICKSLCQPAKPSRLLLSAYSCIGVNNDEDGQHTSSSMAHIAAVFFSCITEIDIILEEATARKFIAAVHTSTTSTSRGAPTAEVVNVGLNSACTQMLDTITGQTSHLQIIPITGMGGIGKTTLASAVYNHSRSLQHFDVRLWVTISQEYDLQEVLRGLLSTVKHTEQPLQTEQPNGSLQTEQPNDSLQTEQPNDSLFDRVHKYLKGRRFLIVLDDMWHGKAWDGVMNAFPDDNKGSRIIITTRELKVASYVGSLSNVHEMQLLDEEQSWVMLRGKVYGKESCPAELGDIGRTISKNCKGLPLAIVVIAGLLKRNKLKEYWKEVAKNTNAAAATDYDQLFGILSLSYTNLPPQLKACFLYVGAYPEDYEFKVKELAMLWTAEGLLKPRKSKTMEDIAEECVEELEERSLLLVKKKMYNGKIKTFSIHDVLREVSMKKAKEEKFLQQNDQHKVSLLKNDLNFHSDTYNAHLRSFKYTIPEGSLCKLVYYALLGEISRVIYSRYYSPITVKCPKPLSVLCKATSLRYLFVENDDNTRYITFPKSISELQNLETVITRNNHYSRRSILPMDIWKLRRLRHIVVEERCKLQFPIASEGDYPILESLQTLSGVRNVNFSMDVIERIPNVKRVKLFYDNEQSQSFSRNNLQHLHQLEELSILHDVKSKQKLSDFSFPHTLKKLSLYNTQIPFENFMPTIASLPNLEVLKLKEKSIMGDIWEPIEGEFLKLKYLKMEDINIKEWRVESFHFPCLRKLEIISCWKLKEVPECIGEIDTLEELVLYSCYKAKESVLTIRENQQAFGNDLLKITISRCG